MKSIKLASLLMICGLAIIIASFLLPYFASSLLTGTWTKQDAETHSKISAELHELAHERGHPQGHSHAGEANHKEKNEAELKREFDEAQKRYDEGNRRLLEAQEMPDRIVFWLRCLGGIMLIAGLAFYYRSHRAEA